MTIYVNLCTGDLSEDDLNTVRHALQQGQKNGLRAAFAQLKSSYPAMYPHMGSNHFRLFLDGASGGRSIYVDTLVRLEYGSAE